MNRTDTRLIARYRDIRRRLLERHGDVHVILAPPRTSSTALVRVFWRHPSIGFYNNEPFDRHYHCGEGMDSVLRHLADAATPVPGPAGGRGLLIKEMTFQATRLELLADLATSPLVFVLRDPRLSVASRMRMVAEAHGDPLFPHHESGVDALYQQVRACRADGRPYVMVHADDFRGAPVPVLSALFARLGLSFREDQLHWQPAPDMRMGNLRGAQDNFYTRILNSRGLEPPVETPPDLARYPVYGGLRAHVRRCLDLYHELLEDPHLIRTADLATGRSAELATAGAGGRA